MELWDEGLPGVLLGIPREAPGIPTGAQGFPNEVPKGAQGIPREVGLLQGSPERPRGSLMRSPKVPKGSPERWDSQRIGIPWLPGWAGLVGLARWKARWATKNLFGVSCWDNIFPKQIYL